MILHNHSDTENLVAPQARSRAGGYTFLGNKEINKQTINGPITIIVKLIKVVMSYTTEAKVAVLYMNAKYLVPLQINCEELGHEQPVTPMRTDNNTTCGIITDTFKQNRSKAIDM